MSGAILTGSSTQIKVLKLSHTWTIHNFSSRTLKTGIYLKSSSFTSSGKNNSKWCLRLFPNGCEEQSNEYLSLFLNLESCDAESVFVKFKLSLWNAREARFEKIGHEEQLSHKFVVNSNEDADHGLEPFYRRSSLLDPANGIISDDTLVLLLEMSEAVETVHISTNTEPQNQIRKFESRIGNHLGKMFHYNKISDLTLYVRDQKFYAHRVILSARSPVFAAMFEHDTLERRRNEVIIKDFNPQVVKEMLTFIYTDESPNVEIMSADLLAIAEKYDLPRLKRICEEDLCTKITTDNAAEILSLANFYNAETLTARTTIFMSNRTTKRRRRI